MDLPEIVFDPRRPGGLVTKGGHVFATVHPGIVRADEKAAEVAARCNAHPMLMLRIADLEEHVAILTRRCERMEAAAERLTIAAKMATA